MELAALVALRLPATILCLARAELAKVLSSLGHYILEQLHLDSPQLLPCSLMSVTMFGVTGRSSDQDGGCRGNTRRRGEVRGKAPSGQNTGAIPPRVTSKKTIGFASVVSAMVVAVQCFELDLYDVRWLRSDGSVGLL
jgi:hypothetical protein